MTRSKRRNGEVLQTLVLAAAATGGEGPCHYPFSDLAGRPGAKIDGVVRSASRAVWMIANGDPGELQVLHTCGNGMQGCVRLGHLYLGTHADNMRDKAVEGSGHRPSGMTNGQAKLTDDQVREMRERARSGAISHQRLASEYGVARRTVGKILARQRWQHLDDAPALEGGRR